MQRANRTGGERHRFHTGPRIFGLTHRLVRDGLVSMGWNEMERELVGIAVAEVLANIAEHGYDGREGMPVTFTFRSPGRGKLEIEVSDRAPRFRLESVPVRDLDELARGLSLRGRGLPLIRRIASEISVSPRAGGGNTFRLVFDARRLAAVVEEHLGQAA